MSSQEVVSVRSKKPFNKKKLIVILLIACALIGIGCGITAVVIKSQNVTAPDGTNLSGIQSEWKKVESANITSAPDTTIKADLLRQFKESDTKAEVLKFNRLKVYSDFRIYDLKIDTGKEENYLLVCYINGKKAIIFFNEQYDTSSDRAKLLSGYIEEFDKSYEKYAKQAQAITDESLIINL